MEYHGFIKSFRRAVEHEGCSKLDCLQHLKNSLDGRPLRDIITFGNDEKDYDSALQLLETNYGDENMVIREILKALFELRPPKYTHDSLAMFRTKVLTHLRSLENFDLFPENCASCNQVLGFVLKDKFPEELRKETSRKHAEERPKDRYNKQMALDSLNVTIDTLSDRTTTGSLVQPPTPSVRPKEKAAVTKSTVAAVIEQPQAPQQSQQTYQSNGPSRKKRNNNFYQQRTQFAPYGPRNQFNRNNNQSYQANANNRFSRPVAQQRQLKCLLCQGQHSAFNCTRYKTVLERRGVVERNRLCTNCLSNTHAYIRLSEQK